MKPRVKMNYIPADKLKAEIEKRMNILDIDSPFGIGGRIELELVLDTITSLQQEQPEVDLEKEVEKFCLEYDARKEVWFNMTPRDQKILSNPTWSNFASNIARHFFELGRNARKSIWHNVAEEVPTEYGSEVIVACKNKNKEDGIWLYDLIQCWEGKWEPRVNWETPVKWAYVEDLDSARKEE